MSEQASPMPSSPQIPSPSTTTTTTTTMPSPAPSSADLTHFLTHPWCATLLSAPNTTLLPTPSRVPKKSTEDSFFAVTLRTGDTIPFMLSFSSPRILPAPSDGVAAASPAPPPAAPGTAAGTGPSAPPAPGTSTEQVSTLFALEAGLNGYPLTAHGGLIAALFDEAMGVSMMRLRCSSSSPKCPAGGGGMDIVTASLKVDFLKRLETPGVVVVRVWVSERRGRKWVLEGEMVVWKGGDGGDGGEGGKEVVVGRARGVWVEVRASL